MTDFTILESKLLKLYNIYSKLNENQVEYEKENSFASENDLRELEAKLECSVPPSMRNLLL